MARQYTGTAGRIENAQVGVFLAYATPHGHTLIDRALYLPKDWAADADRRKAAGVPTTIRFATKIVLARQMIDRAMSLGVPARWVTGDSVYGSDYHFRMSIEGHGLGYVLGVRADFAVRLGLRQVRANALAAGLPARAWRRLRCGLGSKGPRVYDWALVAMNSPEPEVAARWLLVRRSITEPSELAYFACGGPPATTRAELVRVAGSRWSVEECFELAKGECGLDEYEVRSWTGWHRHVSLSLLALAVLAVIRMRAKEPAKKGGKRSCR